MWRLMPACAGRHSHTRALVPCTLPPSRLLGACVAAAAGLVVCVSVMRTTAHMPRSPHTSALLPCVALQAAEDAQQPASTAPAVAAGEQPAAKEQQEGSKAEDSKAAAGTAAEQQAEGKTEGKPAAASTSGGFGGFGGFAGSTGGFGGFSSSTGGFGGFGGAGGFGGLAASAGKGESGGCAPREQLSVPQPGSTSHTPQPLPQGHLHCSFHTYHRSTVSP